ncbi:MAG: hypothetical protein AAGG51_05455 [Cyanobacteria bacterium P01_G01_bin.54]
MTQDPNAQPPETPETRESTPAPDTPSPIIEPPPTFGFSDYAEKINGRFAMVGFFILIGLELLTHQDLFTWLGLR